MKKKTKFEIVIQKQKFGCVPACIATILQVDYWKVASEFRTDFNNDGINIKEAAHYLAGFGFDCIGKYTEYFGSGYKINNRRLLVPFADIHIISIKQFAELEGEKLGHSMIMKKDGKIFCSSDGKLFTKKYHSVDFVLGVFYPTGWKFNKR